MKWEKFDADKINTGTIERIKQSAREILAREKNEVNEIIVSYKKGERSDLNQIINVDTFKPSEFDGNTSNDNSLFTFLSWFVSQNIDWAKGSEMVKKMISNNFQNIGSKTIEGGRERVVLDNLIMVGEKIVAIEVETSNNIDNGYWTLRQAIKTKKADFGIMIVPWFSQGSGRAEEGKALGRLDREFDGKINSNEGPIFRVSPVRKIDAIIQLTK